jgi:ectoine hydroxylase-related dioxygenase (phytanoyl-CoA dioxygenase family)
MPIELPARDSGIPMETQLQMLRDWAENVRVNGAAYLVPWEERSKALELATRLEDVYRPGMWAAIVNPHLGHEWAYDAARALLGPVQAVIGPDVAIVSSRLVMAWPGSDASPWRQDGVDSQVELAIGESVSAWLAISPLSGRGCLEVLPASHLAGYQLGAGCGRVDQPAGTGTSGESLKVPVPAGTALLMHPALFHRCGANPGRDVRIALHIRYAAPDAVTTRDGSPPDLTSISGTGTDREHTEPFS